MAQPSLTFARQPFAKNWPGHAAGLPEPIFVARAIGKLRRLRQHGRVWGTFHKSNNTQGQTRIYGDVVEQSMSRCQHGWRGETWALPSLYVIHVEANSDVRSLA